MFSILGKKKEPFRFLCLLPAAACVDFDVSEISRKSRLHNGIYMALRKIPYLFDLGFISALGRLLSPFLTSGKKSLNWQIKYALVQCWRHSNYSTKLSTNPLLSCIIYINLNCLYYMKKYNFSIEKKIRMCIND